jgi:CHAT domain-containing protein/tetratricopeptide (TPR) repeat protein
MRFIFLTLLLLASNIVSAQTWDSLNTYGLKLYLGGNYDEAKAIMSKALIRAETDSGKISTAYTSSLTTLAQINKATGNYIKAAEQFHAVVVITDKQYTQAHIDRIETRTELANLYLESGQYDSCEFYLRQCLNLFQEALDKNKNHFHENYLSFVLAFANTQNSMASLHRRTGQLQKAIQELEETVSFLKMTLDTVAVETNEYKTLLSNLVSYYLEEGSADKAAQLNREYISLTTDRRSLSYLYALQNQGNIYRRLEQNDSAIHVWSAALSIIDGGLYMGSQLHISILVNLGEVCGYIENYEKAIFHLVKARELLEKPGGVNPRIYQTALLNLALTYFYNLNYKEADAVFATLTDHLLNEVQHNFTYLSENEKISFYRNQQDILTEYIYFALHASGVIPTEDSYQNPDITQNLYNLQILTKGIILNSSHKMKAAILSGGNQRLKEDYLRWEYLKNELALLIRSENPPANQIGQLTTIVDDLEIKLSRESAAFKKGFLVERISWKDIQKKLKPGEAAVEMIRMYNGLLYGALIITPETTERPILAIVKSTETRRLEREYIRQYINAITYKYTDTLSYSVYWKPIADAINKALPKKQKLNRVYFSPDGVYNQINLNTLFDPKSGKHLIDQVEIHQLTNTKELLKPLTKESNSFKHAVLFGNPAFTLSNNTNQELFTELPGTEREVNAIHDLLKSNKWSVELYKGNTANESQIKSISKASILHLATHGFFSDSENTSNSLVWMLINSGIALAGANQPKLLDYEDGILTAYEAVNLNLDQTRLVILSACETGLGEFYPGEGVYGLRLAITAAGASNIMMSLWKVDDTATQELMVSFYKEWLRKPENMRQAFRSAQQQMREKYTHPFYWGAFVLSGY